MFTALYVRLAYQLSLMLRITDKAMVRRAKIAKNVVTVVEILISVFLLTTFIV